MTPIAESVIENLDEAIVQLRKAKKLVYRGENLEILSRIVLVDLELGIAKDQLVEVIRKTNSVSL